MTQIKEVDLELADQLREAFNRFENTTGELDAGRVREVFGRFGDTGTGVSTDKIREAFGQVGDIYKRVEQSKKSVPLFLNLTDPNSAEHYSRGAGIRFEPGLYVALFPVEKQDFENPLLLKDMGNSIRKELAEKGGFDYQHSSFIFHPYRYKMDKSILYVWVEPVYL